MRVQGVRGEMWPVSCGFVPDGRRAAPVETLSRVHA